MFQTARPMKALACGGAFVLASIRQSRSFVVRRNHPVSLNACRLFLGRNSDCKSFLSTHRAVDTSRSASPSESSESPVPTVMVVPPTVPLHGDFIGYLTNFDLEGKLLEIPEHLVPSELLEWGQAPSSLEIITSEDVLSSSVDVWNRQTITILPAVGCGVDNLETTKSVEAVDNKNLYGDETTVRALLYRLPNNAVRLEATFGTDAKDQRIRVSVEVLDQKLKPPVRVIVERQFDNVSSNGKRAHGGGLDGRTVSTWMGEEMKKYVNIGKEALDQSTKSVDNDSSSILRRIDLPADLTVDYDESDDKLHVVFGKKIDEEFQHRVSFQLLRDGRVQPADITVLSKSCMDS